VGILHEQQAKTRTTAQDHATRDDNDEDSPTLENFFLDIFVHRATLFVMDAFK